MANIHVDIKELLKEWHSELNEGIDPKKLSHGSGKKVWWRCSRSELHVWEAEFRGRISGKGCPYCAGKKVSADNNLEKNYPDIAAQWHPTKNLGLSPSEVISGSHKTFWWQCQVDSTHEWQATAQQRTSRSTGCPFCSGRRATSEDNFALQFPELALEWHPSKNKNLSPNDVKSKSGKIIWWKCKTHPEHVWKCRLIDRTDRGHGCPYCSNHRVSSLNNLATQNPTLAKEWNFEKNGHFMPDQFTAGSDKIVWWRCKRFPEHEWEARIANRSKGRGCPYCTSQTSEPEIRIVCELRKLFSQNKIQWRTKISGHEVDVFLEHINVGIEFDGLRWHKHRLAADKTKNVKLNSLGITLIRFREEPLPLLDPYDISVTTPLAKNDLNSLVTILREFVDNTEEQACENYLNYSDFINPKDYRKYLSYLPNPPPEHSLKIRYPEVCKEWDFEGNHPLVPENFLPFSSKKVWWKCAQGHRYEAVISQKTSGKKCSKCNSLEILMPQLALQWHPTKNGDLLPHQVTKRSSKRVWWQCGSNKEHEWVSTVDNRSAGHGCPFCAGNKATSSNNLKIAAPDLCKEWHPNRNGPLKPESFLPNSNKTVWWQCRENKNHEWRDMIHIRRRGKGCPFCKV